jgi:DNA-directed RNA polymerase specialized sigma24 family protein
MAVAQRARAIVSQFDATTYRVFELYCVHELSAAEVAIKMQTSKTAVMRRLMILQQKAGLKAKELRRISSHFQKGSPPKPRDEGVHE